MKRRRFLKAALGVVGAALLPEPASASVYRNVHVIGSLSDDADIIEQEGADLTGHDRLLSDMTGFYRMRGVEYTQQK